jgi:hypothetical protein
MNNLLNNLIIAAAIPPLIAFNPFLGMVYDSPGSEKNKFLHAFVATSAAGPLFWAVATITNSIKPLVIYTTLWYTSALLVPYWRKKIK